MSIEEYAAQRELERVIIEIEELKNMRDEKPEERPKKVRKVVESTDEETTEKPPRRKKSHR